MVATEEKRLPDGESGGKRKKSPLWLWPLLVFSDVIFLSLVAYFLVARPRTGLLESLVRLIDVHFTWIGVCIVLFIAVALFFAIGKSKQPVEELTTLANAMGWTLERRWGFPGGFGAVSLFGYGPYFTVRHKGLRLAFSLIMDEDNRELGLRVTAFHERPLGLGLMIKSGIGFFMMPDEYKGILSRKIGISLQDVQAWAGDRDKAMNLLSNRGVVNSLGALKGRLEPLNEQAESRLISRSSGFVINDRRINLLLSKNHHLNRDLVDALCDLSLALTGTDLIPAISVSKAGDRVYKAVLVTLISLVAASLIWVMTDYIRDIL